MGEDGDLRAALAQIANGAFRDAKGQTQRLRRGQMMNLARRVCRSRSWSFDDVAAQRRVGGGPLPPFTDEQRRIYAKLRRVIGREAAIKAALASGEAVG